MTWHVLLHDIDLCICNLMLPRWFSVFSSVVCPMRLMMYALIGGLVYVVLFHSLHSVLCTCPPSVRCRHYHVPLG